MASEASNSGEGSLERLHIAVSTTAPEDLLTPNAARAVRFHKSKPWGLLESEVKDFQEITVAALAWYLEKIHQRDMDVYTLGKELDTRETQIANLNLQLASAQYNSGVKDAIDRNEEDKEMSDLLSRVAEQEADLGALRQNLAAAQQELTITHQALLEAQQSIQAVEPVESSAPTPADDSELVALREELATAQLQVSTLETANRQLEDFADQQEKYIDSLLNQFEADAGTAVNDDPDIAEDDDAELDDEDLYPVYEDGTIADQPLAGLPLADDEQTYVQDDTDTDEEDELYDADDLGETYEDEDDEEEQDFEPEPVVAPQPPVVQAPEQPVNQPSPPETFTYNGVKLPPGIRPEDL